MRKDIWYTRQDGVEVLKRGRYKLVEVYKRPHGGYCCNVFNKGNWVAGNGYFTKSLPSKKKVKAWIKLSLLLTGLMKK